LISLKKSSVCRNFADERAVFLPKYEKIIKEVRFS